MAEGVRYKLTYIRGSSGILVILAEELKKSWVADPWVPGQESHFTSGT